MSPKPLQPQSSISSRFKLLLVFSAGVILGFFTQFMLSPFDAKSSELLTKKYASKGMVASLKDIPHRPTSHIDTGNK
jgi:hypothetical protein